MTDSRARRRAAWVALAVLGFACIGASAGVRQAAVQPADAPPAGGRPGHTQPAAAEPPASPAATGGSFSFAVLGDAPYNAWEEKQYGMVLDEMNDEDLAFVLHVGDIFWKPCSDGHYREAQGWFGRVRHPLVLTPGDNEWVDCWEEASGGFVPRERLRRLRETFYPVPSQSLGGRPLPLATQAGADSFPEFVEHARWIHEGVVFVTVHIPGSMNAREPFPGRTPGDDVAADRRTAAATSWMREAFVVAREHDAPALVLAFHANPSFEDPPANFNRRAFEPFLGAFEEEVARFGRPVLVTHGDHHEFIVDNPYAGRAAGPRLKRLTRMQVPGSPRVGWVRVTFTPGAAEPFTFDCRVVPRWKLW